MNLPKINICDGSGMCLMQTGENTYTKMKDFQCDHNCKPIQCPNHIICNAVVTQCYLDCCSGLCANCDISFGTWNGGKGILNTKQNIECCVCLEENMLGISGPRCKHYLCIDCFKKIYWPEVKYDENDEEIEPEEWFSKCPLCRAHAHFLH